MNMYLVSSVFVHRETVVLLCNSLRVLLTAHQLTLATQLITDINIPDYTTSLYQIQFYPSLFSRATSLSSSKAI